MNGDVYRLREELLERLDGLEKATTLIEEGYENHRESVYMALRELSDRIEALPKCQCGNKATKELRTSFAD